MNIPNDFISRYPSSINEELEIEDLEKLRSRYGELAQAARLRLHITGGIDALLDDIPDD